MLLIAHRGNVAGPDPANENNPDFVQSVLSLNYDVEIDVWYRDGRLMLGHDSPVYPIEPGFLRQSGLWCHAKNAAALQYMLDLGAVHCFFHDTDDVALTSRGYLWTYPDQPLYGRSVSVLLGAAKLPTGEYHGVCSDYVSDIRHRYNLYTYLRNE